MTTKAEVKEVNVSKKERSEQLRQEAMWRRSEDAKKRKDAIAFGIGQIDAAPNAQGKRTVFEDDSDEEVGFLKFSFEKFGLCSSTFSLLLPRKGIGTSEPKNSSN